MKKKKKTTRKTTGKLIAYKKCRELSRDGLFWRYFLLTLEIPKDAQRVFPPGALGKARAAYAKVLKIEEIVRVGQSPRRIRKRITHQGWGLALNKKLVYSLGKIVKPDDFCSEKTKKCGAGINFFLSLEKALAWYY